jgi:hypothetical protein
LGDGKDGITAQRIAAIRPLRTRFSFRLLATVTLLYPALAWGGQAPESNPGARAAEPLPEAPQPQVIKHQKKEPCRVIPKNEISGMALADAGGATTLALAGVPFIPSALSGQQAAQTGVLPPCTPPPVIDWFDRFLNGPEVKPLTPKEKARLAVRNLLDPFNAVTILGQSAIAIGSDSHSPYGPGMAGFARNVGVSYTQEMTGEFVGTFLIPSIMREDPHYHRMPKATIKRRIVHAITQVAWTQGDNGKGMLNYSNLLGYAIEEEISNLYVPGEQTNLPSTAARYSIALATAPTDNFITEFLPDVARRIHFRVVLFQRIINQVAKTEAPGTP